MVEKRSLRAEFEAVLDQLDADPDDLLTGLGRLVELLRRQPPSRLDDAMVELCEVLEADEERRQRLSAAFCHALCGVRVMPAFTESGITSDRGFFDEAARRLSHTLLPEVDPPDDLRTVIRRLFPSRHDHEWVALIGKLTWRRFLRVLGATSGDILCSELIGSIRLLALNIASLGLAPEITDRMPELDELSSPFMRLTDEAQSYARCLTHATACTESTALGTLQVTLRECQQAVEQLRARKQRVGTSLQLTSLSFRLLQQIDRLGILLRMTGHILHTRAREETARAQADEQFHDALIELIRDLVQAENTRNSLRAHLRQRADLLSYQVVEHAARRGSKYITTSRPEYLAFFRASLGGGLIVGLFAIAKLIVDGLDLSLAGDAILFSLNYALAFLLIQATGAALATKQPAMTASTIARSLDRRDGGHDVPALAELIVCVARSQFVSFVGNLAAAFPIAWLLSYLLGLSGLAPATPAKAEYLLAAQHPWASGAAFYAGVAGVYLFCTGLISGYFDNRNLYARIADRLAAHPGLNSLLGPALTQRLAQRVDAQLGAVAGNVFLGICLGSTGTLGTILGLPFDIRHIAFSAAHVGVGVQVLGPGIPLTFLLEVLGGVAVIGFVNFGVSFGLALAMAVESRQVGFRETWTLLRLLLVRLVTRPWHFVFPPAEVSPTAAEGT